MRGTTHRIVIPFLLVAILAACGDDTSGSTTVETVTETTPETSGDGDSNGAAADGGDECPTVDARASHHIGEGSATDVAMRAMAEEVSDTTEGRVNIEVFPGGQLGGLVDNAEGVRTGAIELALADSSSMSNMVAELGALDLPFIFETQQEFNDLMDGDFGAYVNDRLREEVGVEPLYWVSVGVRNIFLAPSAPEVREPADLSGVTLRVPDAPVYQQTFELLGATAIVVDATELYSSVQTGVVDGFEFPLGTAVDLSMDEVVDKMATTGHIHTNVAVTASQSFIDSLCEEDREALFTAAANARELEREQWIEDNEAALTILEEAGVQTIEADRQAFIDAVSPMYEEFRSSIGSELFDGMQQGLGR